MARKPDEPGKYRIKRKLDGTWWLGGLQKSGKRVRSSFESEKEARDAARVLFPQSPPVVVTAPREPPKDDWGLPIAIGDSTAAAFNANLGVPPPPPPIPEGAPPEPAPPDPDEAAKREKQKKQNLENAKSLCEMLGIGWAAADVWAGNRVIEWRGKEPVRPAPSQVKGVANAMSIALQSTFGDMEVGPWTMCFLLTLALPCAMVMSATKDKPKVEPSTDQPQANLKSV